MKLLALTYKILALLLLSLSSINNLTAVDEDLFKKGEQAFNSEDFGSAILIMNQVLEKDTLNIRAYYLRGVSSLYVSDLPTSYQDFSTVIRLDPNNSDAYNNRGIVNSFSGNFEEAKTDFDKAIEFDPKFAQAYISRGGLFMEFMNYPDALKDFDKAIELDNKNPFTYFQRGMVNYKLNDYTKAEKDFSIAIKKGYVNNQIYYNRGNSYYKMKKYKQAIADYNKTMELDPTDTQTYTQALNNRAMSYDLSGNKKKAEVDRSKLKKLATDIENLVPIDSLNFVRYSSPTGRISIELPEGWYESIEDEGATYNYIVTQDKPNQKTKYYDIGVIMSLNTNMMELYQVQDPQGLLDFWRGSIVQNTVEYHKYEIFSQKMFNKDSYQCLLNKVLIQITEKHPPMRLYELVMAKDDTLFFAYFQAPEYQFGYYSEIFEKAIETIKVK